jgi:hypothetical protein
VRKTCFRLFVSTVGILTLRLPALNDFDFIRRQAVKGHRPCRAISRSNALAFAAANDITDAAVALGVYNSRGCPVVQLRKWLACDRHESDICR